MKPFDTKGEYTPEEVKAALAGINGTRQLSFRYERLNKDNGFIEDIDYITKCSVENNSLADIKRTAKFDILDTGTINYLQDRIKPYIRLAMPADETYRGHVRSLDPAVWWRMDDADRVYAGTASSTAPLDNSYNTRETAMVVDPFLTSTVDVQTSVNDAGVRDEFWMSLDIDDSDPLMFKVTAATPVLTEIYTSPTIDGELTLVKTTTHQNIGYYPEYFRFAFPSRGYYFLRLTGHDTINTNVPSIQVSRPARLDDSSNNHVTAVGLNLPLGANSLIDDNGSSFWIIDGVTAAGYTWGVDDTNIPLQGGLTLNYWYDPTVNSTDSVMMSAEVTTSSMKIDFDYFDQPTGQSWVEVKAYPTDGTVQDVTFSRPMDFNFSKFRSGTHMLTFVIAPDASRTDIYVDGILEYTLTNTQVSTQFDYLNAFVSDSITNIAWDVSCGGNLYIDDITMFSKPLVTSNISMMYAMGVSEGVGNRSGYVEWPQGVFVLSSPTRTMQDGNTIVRAVDGYDQLVNLKEDSFDYRYSVKTGAKYTEAIFQVLQSSKPKATYPLSDSFWSTTGSAQITSESSVLLYTVDAAPAGIYTGLDLTLKDISVSAKMDGPSTPSTTNTQMQIEYRTPQNTLKTLWIGKMGANIKFVDENADSYTSAWNAVSDAYWRLRESGGYMYFETSANNVAWTERRKLKLTTDTYVPTRVVIIADHDEALVGSAASEVSVSGYGLVDAAITKSTATLPTGMEWEPGTTKLSIINDLLGAINYESATYDENGTFIGRPYVSPQQRTPGFRYATDHESVIRGDVDQTLDIFSIPNKWVVVVSDPDRPMLVGEYVNDDPHSPTSTVSRGRTIVDYRTEQSAPDQLTLDAQAARLAFEASQVYESIEFDTALMPIHQNGDVYEVVIDGLVINHKYSEVSWSMELKVGATMSHKCRRVVSV